MRRIRLGMVGGGTDAVTGEVHRIASRIDGHFDWSQVPCPRHPKKPVRVARRSGWTARACDSFGIMAETEGVSIVTSNNIHYLASQAFLSCGIHVICDKPLTASVEDAAAMECVVVDSDALFVLTHNDTD